MPDAQLGSAAVVALVEGGSRVAAPPGSEVVHLADAALYAAKRRGAAPVAETRRAADADAPAEVRR